VVVETITSLYPELVPYLAPVTSPPVAEARYLRALYDTELSIVWNAPVKRCGMLSTAWP